MHKAWNTSYFDVVNITKLKACKVHADAFKTGAEACLGKTVGARKTRVDVACSCWTNSSLKEHFDLAKDCKFQEEAKKFAASLKTCRNKFSECRKYEDDAAHTISACSKNSDDLVKKVGLLVLTSIYYFTLFQFRLLPSLPMLIR